MRLAVSPATLRTAVTAAALLVLAAVPLEAQRRHDRRYERRTERRGWDDTRPRFGVGAGFDIRRFGGDDDRFLAHAGIDFRAGGSGVGVRPEILYGWTERQSPTLEDYCPACGGGDLVPVASAGRSQLLGVMVNGTYTFARRSSVRPYLLGGIGVLSTRTPEVTFTDPTVLALLAVPTGRDTRVDVALGAGAGLEVGIAGPVRVFSEFRYVLTDTAEPLGFSGMLPLTFGLRF